MFIEMPPLWSLVSVAVTAAQDQAMLDEEEENVLQQLIRLLGDYEINTVEMADRMSETLRKFPEMGKVFSEWQRDEWTRDRRDEVLESISGLPFRHRSALEKRWCSKRTRTIWKPISNWQKFTWSIKIMDRLLTTVRSFYRKNRLRLERSN